MDKRTKEKILASIAYAQKNGITDEAQVALYVLRHFDVGAGYNSDDAHIQVCIARNNARMV